MVVRYRGDGPAEVDNTRGAELARLGADGVELGTEVGASILRSVVKPFSRRASAKPRP